MTEAFPAGLTDTANMARLRSGAAARLAGVPVATLRVWERRYAVVAAPKTATGQRLYSGHDVQRLRLIKQLTERGHAIGTIAVLALPALEALTAGELTASAPLPAAAPARRACVVGRAAAQKLQAAGVMPLRVWPDLDEAEAQAQGPAAGGAVEVLLVQVNSLQPLAASRVRALAQRLQAAAVVVLYAFGAEAVAETLRAAGATVRREPATGRELAALLGAAPTAPTALTAHAAAPLPPALPAVEPRIYSDEALAALAELPSSVACECPRHMAEIVMQLAGFERYSAECLARSPADAALHRHLAQVAGAARSLFERAVERLVAEEGLVLAPSASPTAAV
jgi:DNA-binding transcriptional MerR regulator